MTRMLRYEKNLKARGFQHIVGIDEAGRGPLAGPVVAAAVVLRRTDFRNKVNDSKRLSSLEREKAYLEIGRKAYVGVGIMNESVIDAHNILTATFLAMTNAVHDLLSRMPRSIVAKKNFRQRVCLLVDGNRFQTDLPFAHKTLVRGDSLSLSVACASIIAKVTRDRMLMIYHQIFPQYGFDHHKGYPTSQHRKAIETHGLSMIHRKTFRSGA